MRILVLGSEGQIGKPTCEHLKKMGHEVIEIDIKINKYHDLRDRNILIEGAVKACSFVFYFASDVGGAKYLEANEHSYEFIKNNMQIMTTTFSLLEKYNKPFIFTSSQMAELSHSTYGMLKLLGEKMTNDLGGLVVRLWNVYGMEHDDEKSHVITDFCSMAKHNGYIKMRTDGSESRQLLYVDDCVEALEVLATRYYKLERDKNYHITSFEWNTIFEVASIIQNISSCGVEIGDRKDLTQMNAMNPPDPYIINYWRPKTSLVEGITKIYEAT